MLSLETHLGVTTSPHVPFPTGFVTLPMCNRSPPLRLSLAHRSERAINKFLLYYRLAFQTCSGSGNVIQTPPKAGRTVSNVSHPLGIRCISTKVAGQVILNIRRSSATALAAVLFLARNALQAIEAHQPCNTVQAATLAFVVEIVPDPARTQDTITLCMQYADTIQQALILSCPWTQWTSAPTVITAW
jgi:hypothetical protein